MSLLAKALQKRHARPTNSKVPGSKVKVGINLGGKGSVMQNVGRTKDKEYLAALERHQPPFLPPPS